MQKYQTEVQNNIDQANAMQQVKLKTGELIPSKQSSVASISPANNRNGPQVMIDQATIGTMDDRMIGSQKTDVEPTDARNMLDMKKISIDLHKMQTAAGGHQISAIMHKESERTVQTQVKKGE